MISYVGAVALETLDNIRRVGASGISFHRTVAGPVQGLLALDNPIQDSIEPHESGG
jgi:hypothetical protein